MLKLFQIFILIQFLQFLAILTAQDPWKWVRLTCPKDERQL